MITTEIITPKQFKEMLRTAETYLDIDRILEKLDENQRLSLLKLLIETHAWVGLNMRDEALIISLYFSLNNENQKQQEELFENYKRLLNEEREALKKRLKQY